MVETVIAVCENGILKPLDEIHVINGKKVKLTIETDDEILNLATSVYEGLSDKEINEVEKIAFERKDLFV